MNWKILKEMTTASVKMYYRDFTAIFFSLIFPIIFLVVFGFAFSNDDIKLGMKLYNDSDSTKSTQLEEAIGRVGIFEELPDEINLQQAKEKISDGELNFIVEIPETFGEMEKGEIQGEINLFINEGDQDFNPTIDSIISEILNEFNIAATKEITGSLPIDVFKINTEGVSNEDLTTIDYIVPGIIGFSIMSLGVFSISQGFIFYKSSGALRRLFVAPINPLSFIIAQSLTRLLMVLFNIWTMLLLAKILFDFNMVGDIINFSILSLVGAVLFLGMGFAITGWAKNENQAAPVANIIFFPMMFLSGTFFPRELFPDAIQPVIEVMPLSYLTDGLRLVANDAATVITLGGEMLGMIIWIIITYAIAVKVFRWE